MIDWISLMRVSIQGNYGGSWLLAIGYWLSVQRSFASLRMTAPIANNE
jgi:hypothetical protein